MASGAVGSRRPAPAPGVAGTPPTPGRTPGASGGQAPAGQTTPSRWAQARAWLDRALDRYPALGPAPQGRAALIGNALVALLVLAYVTFFTLYLFTIHDAYQTHAEDMGIMVQALWNTTHGALLHQTICDSISDNNCLGDISRFAIHFEPIMLPIALLYRLIPSPKTLQFLQVAVVASGAFPAHWIASRRLRSTAAGVVFAGVYLLYPSLQAAVVFDFHAVTLSAAFLMFALFFLLDRNDLGLVIACLLALATKEEVVVGVALIGLSAALLQRRWRLGLGLVGLSACWLVMELVIMHAASPIGHSPTASRYAALGSSPVQVARYLLTHPVAVIQQYVLQGQHQYYLRLLLAPGAYLALLSPLTLAIAVPVLAINLLSSDPSMYSGVYQYSAEIIPIFVLATIESVALVAACANPVTRWVAPRVEGWLWRRPRLGLRWSASLRSGRAMRLVLLVLVGVVALASLRAQRLHGDTPLTQGFAWPQVTAHDQIANELLPLIPPAASVSAQSDLLPHLAERRYVYLYPYDAQAVDYVFLDVTGNLYPQLADPATYFAGVQALLQSGRYGVVAARDGYLLLKRLPQPAAAPMASAPSLPSSFYSFAVASPGQVMHPMDVQFGSSLELIGYEISPSARVYLNDPYVTVTTYWRVLAPLSDNPRPQLVLTLPNGKQQFDSRFATIQWLPMSEWQPGTTYAVTTWPQLLNGSEQGIVRLGTWVLTQPPDGGPAKPLLVTQRGPEGANGQQVMLLNGGADAVFAELAVSG